MKSLEINRHSSHEMVNFQEISSKAPNLLMSQIVLNILSTRDGEKMIYMKNEGFLSVFKVVSAQKPLH